MDTRDDGLDTPTIPDLSGWLSLQTVAKKLGVRPLLVWAWVTSGVKTDTGRLRLAGLKLGGRWKVDPAAVEPFLMRTTANALGGGPDVLPPPSSAAGDRRRVNSSLARLRALGIGGEPGAPPERVVSKRGRRGHAAKRAGTG